MKLIHLKGDEGESHDDLTKRHPLFSAGHVYFNGLLDGLISEVFQLLHSVSVYDNSCASSVQAFYTPDLILIAEHLTRGIIFPVIVRDVKRWQEEVRTPDTNNKRFLPESWAASSIANCKYG